LFFADDPGGGFDSEQLIPEQYHRYTLIFAAIVAVTGQTILEVY